MPILWSTHFYKRHLFLQTLSKSSPSIHHSPEVITSTFPPRFQLQIHSKFNIIIMLALCSLASKHIDDGAIPARSLTPALSRHPLWVPINVSSSPSCVTTFPVRLHRAEPQITQGALAARKTWLDMMPGQDLRPHSAGPHGNFFALCWPDGKTDRVALATEIIETLWLYDGKISRSLSPQCISIQANTT